MTNLANKGKNSEIKSNSTSYEKIMNDYASNFGFNLYNNSKVSGICKNNTNFVNGEIMLKKR